MFIQNILSIFLRKNRLVIDVRRYNKVSSSGFQQFKSILVSQNTNFLNFSDYSSKCWRCNYPQKSIFFCSNCKTLQKLPKNSNYFDIIGIKKDFDITVTEVQHKYRQLQSILHPDKFGQKSEEEKEISKNVSSIVNKAYVTLLDPLSRGLYMLKLYNVNISENTSSLDNEFLMNIMEKNEEIEMASDNIGKIQNISKENRVILNILTKQISKAFHDEDINQATKLLIKMKYYVSINDRLKKIKHTLGIFE